MDITNKIMNLLKIMRTFKNWPDAVKDAMGLYNNFTYVLKTRDGMRIKLRSGKSDLGIINELIINPTYDDFDGMKTIIDIGAHIGVFSLIAARGGAKVYSYEPLPENFDMLEENAGLNGFNIHPFNLAVAEKRGLLYLNDYGYPAAGSFTDKPFLKLKKKIPVKCITLKDIFIGLHLKEVDLLKLDCEGAEYNILMNTEPKYLKRCKRMFIECAKWVDANRPEEIRKRLESMGFETEKIPDVRCDYLICYRG